MVAGHIDAVFNHADTKKFHMVDWKRVEEDFNPAAGIQFNRFGRGPCSSLVDNKFNHYVAQQNLYAAILQDCYGIELESMSLVQLHSNRSTYVVVPVPQMLDVARSMLKLARQDRLGGMPSTIVKDEAVGVLHTTFIVDDDLWRARLKKRRHAVAAIKTTAEYNAIRISIAAGALDLASRPVTPDATDRCTSKRSWEEKVMIWRRKLVSFSAPSAGQDNSLGHTATLCLANAADEEPLDLTTHSRQVCPARAHRLRDVCLVDALNSFGLHIEVFCSGPFWALFDGNRMLTPYSLALVPVPRTIILRRGRFVLHRDFHFFALSHADCLIQVDGGLRKVLSLADLVALCNDEGLVVFELVSHEHSGHFIMSSAWKVSSADVRGA